MKQDFFIENRKGLYGKISERSLVIMFSGHAPVRTNDENYPFFADRNYTYLAGVEQEDSVFMAEVFGNGEVEESLYILPSDLLLERWNGKRFTREEAEEKSGIKNIFVNTGFMKRLEEKLIVMEFDCVYMDFGKLSPKEEGRESYRLAGWIRKHYPYVHIKNLNVLVRELRTYKKPEEIQAIRMAEQVTKEGIEAMMRASKPGMYEYQYKAEFDYALAQRGILTPGFPSIISAGKNNFCIHYYSYRGQAAEGDLILNDVGSGWDLEINDVSRVFPCSGKFTEKQRLLYECAYRTSEHMFDILKPGIPMKDVDLTARKYNYEQLKEIGLCKSYDDIGTYMWHGGAHHIGLDVHDPVGYDLVTAPGMVFCVDIGIYCEEWGIGFRLEDNCLITENGCENLSSMIPRKAEDIEAFMGTR